MRRKSQVVMRKLLGNQLFQWSDGHACLQGQPVQGGTTEQRKVATNDQVDVFLGHILEDQVQAKEHTTAHQGEHVSIL